MTCLKHNRQGTEILLAYAAGTLDAARTGSLEAHAAECEECRDLLHAQKHVWSMLDALDAPDVSADFDARLYARIKREQTASSWTAGCVRWLRGFAPGSFLWNPVSWKPSWMPMLAGAVAMAVLVVGLFIYVPAHVAKTQPGPAQVRPESVDAEQMEVTIEDLEMLMPPTASAGRM